MTTDLVVLGQDLHTALVRRRARSRRRRRWVLTATVVGLVASAFSAAAIASGIGDDLQLDPTKWTILGGASVDQGRGEFVHAERTSDGSHSTFLVEHDGSLPPYGAFLLHEHTLAAAQASSPVPVRVESGDLCTPAALAHAESVAMSTLRAQFPPGADIDTTRSTIDGALQAAFAGAPCRGLEYAGEQARLVYAGIQPTSTLMPGVR
jgi:hypothetical protein